MAYGVFLPPDFYLFPNGEITNSLLVHQGQLQKVKSLAKSLFLSDYLVLQLSSTCLLYIFGVSWVGKL